LEFSIVLIEPLLQENGKFSRLRADSNPILRYISQFEKDLEEKENLIRELFFQEYIVIDLV